MCDVVCMDVECYLTVSEAERCGDRGIDGAQPGEIQQQCVCVCVCGLLGGSTCDSLRSAAMFITQLHSEGWHPTREPGEMTDDTLPLSLSRSFLFFVSPPSPALPTSLCVCLCVCV